MRNPFRLLKYMVKARRPSRVTEMEVVGDDFWLRKNYEALTFFGYIVCRKEQAERPLDPVVRNHETIHLRQAQACHDSWLCFYLLYIWYYLRALPLNRRLKNAAYRLNPFEMEAYEHQTDFSYLAKEPTATNGWRRYARLKPHQRLNRPS